MNGQLKALTAQMRMDLIFVYVVLLTLVFQPLAGFLSKDAMTKVEKLCMDEDLGTVQPPRVRIVCGKIKSRMEQPRRTTDDEEDDFCEALCGAGHGGALCGCSVMRPAFVEAGSWQFSRSKVAEHGRLCKRLCDAAEEASNFCDCLALTLKNPSSPKPPPSTFSPTETDLCVDLCRTSDGGALCQCGDMPPAVRGRSSTADVREIAHSKSKIEAVLLKGEVGGTATPPNPEEKKQNCKKLCNENNASCTCTNVPTARALLPDQKSNRSKLT